MRTLSLALSLALASLSGCTYGRYNETTTTDTRPDVTVPTLGTVPDPTADADGDGFKADVDCDDSNVAIYPGAEETCDGVDQNCSGVVDEGIYMCQYSDNDFDGFTPNTGDCDDYNELANPDAHEECNGFDDDCDGTVDETEPEARTNECGDVDGDEDGYYADLDCNDLDAGIHPDALDIPYNGVDEDCSGGDLVDADGDGHNAIAALGDDCNDVDAAVYPGATEVVGNGKDDDCNLSTPDGAETDADGDGASVEDGDCDDSRATVYPAAPELCDGLDNDCDTVIDDNVETVAWYPDADGDGHGDADASATQACSAPAGQVSSNDDCDDALATVNPDEIEVAYDGIDQDCAGGDLVDVDCDLIAAPIDCDDTDANVNPLATEIVGNGKDDDCDASTSDDAAVDLDADNDGVNDDLDCDDGDDLIFPGATEIADDGIDQDCNGSDLITVVEPAHPEDCAAGFSKVYGTFVGPVGSTVTSISGERIPLVGSDDIINWGLWTDGSPVGMDVTLSANVASFVLDLCVDDAADWNASVAYTDINGAVHYDCEHSAFTGTWTVEFDNDVQTVTPEVWDLVNGSCNPLW